MSWTLVNSYGAQGLTYPTLFPVSTVGIDTTGDDLWVFAYSWNTTFDATFQIDIQKKPGDVPLPNTLIDCTLFETNAEFKITFNPALTPPQFPGTMGWRFSYVVNPNTDPLTLFHLGGIANGGERILGNIIWMRFKKSWSGRLPGMDVQEGWADAGFVGHSAPWAINTHEIHPSVTRELIVAAALLMGNTFPDVSVESGYTLTSITDGQDYSFPGHIGMWVAWKDMGNTNDAQNPLFSGILNTGVDDASGLGAMIVSFFPPPSNGGWVLSES